MRNIARRVFVCLVVPLFICANPSSYAQDATTASSSASYARRPPVDATAVQPFTPNTVLVLPGDTSGSASTSGGLLNLRSTNPSASSVNANISGLDTVPTFDGAYFTQAGPDSNGLKLWRFSMLGNDPFVGGTTVIPSKVREVSLQLLNADGSTFMTLPFAPFHDLTKNSPNFVNASYTSSPLTMTQFADAVQRAEFFNLMKPDWHTLLSQPQIPNDTGVTIVVPRFVNVRLSNGNIIQARSYFTGTAADGSTFVLMLNLLFNFFFDNIVVNDINAGNFTTDALNMTLFPNTFLFSLNTNNPNTPGACCVLGFHTFFFQPGAIPQPRWTTLYASWISPGLFGGGFQDVTALSHEISESFNDPFVDNATSSWQFPGVPANAKVCQNNLETGDPVEVLPTATVPIFVIVRRQLITYHPQTEALLQWFEMGKNSNAILNTAGTDGAYSYPNDTALPHSALPCPL
jgi:hypothetical protein